MGDQPILFGLVDEGELSAGHSQRGCVGAGLAVTADRDLGSRLAETQWTRINDDHILVGQRRWGRTIAAAKQRDSREPCDLTIGSLA